MSELSDFARRRNWLLARVAGSVSIYTGYNMRGFAPDIRTEAREIQDAILEFEGKLSRTWELQKHYFLEGTDLEVAQPETAEMVIDSYS